MGLFILLMVILVIIMPEILAFFVLAIVSAAVMIAFIGSWLVGIPYTVEVNDEKWVYRWFWRIK